MQTATVHQPPKYRADIDGLRAVAVLLVVLEHLQFRHFGGGYIGVDVFFVISGYLIGSSMLAEFRAGTFSLLAFYERRVRRIFPALLVMLTVVSLLAYRYLMPRALVGYAGSLLAALLSFSNFFFWAQAGYFEAQSSTKPLLHTWSLGVEEQFYVFFPLLLFLLFRWRPQRLRSALWSLLTASLLAACWMMRFNAGTAFFWSPLRAWELLAGVMISQYSFVMLRSRWLRELATIVGLALVLYAGLFYTSQTAFPGWSALTPCLGAVLLLAAGQIGTSGVGRLLSLSPLRFVGLISYSLYLWHWPLLVFQNTSMMVSSRPIWVRSTKLTLLVLSLLLATLSWWLVETPFRKGKLKPARRPLFAIISVGALLVAAFSGWVVHQRGISSRFPAEVQRLATFDNYDVTRLWRQGTCFLLPNNAFHDFKPAECLGREAGRRTYLLYGDSTAAQLYPGLVKTFPEIHFQQATASACQPYEDGGQDSPFYYGTNCAALWQYIRRTYLAEQRPDAVILAGDWKNPDFTRLGQEIATLQGHGIAVILVGPVIRFYESLPFLLSNEMLRGRSPAVGGEEISQRRIPGDIPLDSQMEKLARDRWKVRYISHVNELCGRQIKAAWQTTDSCPLLLPGGEPLIFDSHHLTRSGSELFAKQVRADGLLP